MPSAMMIFLDPPDHTRLRSLVYRAFTPRRIAHLEDRIRELCAELPRRVARRRAVRLRAGLRRPAAGDGDRHPARRAPSRPAARPRADRHHVPPRPREGDGQRRLADAPASSCTSTSRTSSAKRRADPQDDMITDLDGGRADRRRRARSGTLTTYEAASFADLLVSAGTETVARLLGWAAVLLDEHPDQRADLAADPDVIPNAVEELLRYEAPSPVQGRWLTRDVELHGVTIPADSKVLLLTGSAGRDERKYPDAEPLRRAPDLRPPRLVRLRHPLLPRRRRWPGWRAASPSRRCWPAGPSGPSTATPPSACTRAPCGAGSTCR